MRHTRLILLISLIAVPASSFATQIIIGKGTRSFPINSLTFGITSPSGTSPGTSPCVIEGVQVPNCDFVNESGSAWTNLFFAFSPSQPGNNFSCSGGLWFNTCQFDFGPNGEATGVFFFNIPPVVHCDPATDDFCGIPSGSPGDFTFTVVDFTAPTDFDGQANIPEPATFGLFLLGLLGLGMRRYRRHRALL
ncbi:MAG: PEP-CTERM sorting domain-containing protein [Terriglobia bacterium]